MSLDPLYEELLDEVSGHQPTLLTGGQRQMLARATNVAHEYYWPLVLAARLLLAEHPELREPLAQVGAL